jgi:uncharacterized protein with GYD domain
MPTYIGLLNWTDKGAQEAADSVRRAQQNRAALERMGVKLSSIYWTQGPYDVVVTLDAPDEQTASAAMLAAVRGGYFRGLTMRAFNEQEMQQIAQKMG